MDLLLLDTRRAHRIDHLYHGVVGGGLLGHGELEVDLSGVAADVHVKLGLQEGDERA
jgi:hypothetical protein